MPLDIGRAAEILRGLGGEEEALGAVLEARGALGAQGPTPAALEGLDPADLAILDRVASGQRDRARFGLPIAAASGVGYAGYEALKGLAERVRPARAALRGLGHVFGSPGETELDETSSPASLANVEAYFAGIRGR